MPLLAPSGTPAIANIKPRNDFALLSPYTYSHDRMQNAGHDFFAVRDHTSHGIEELLSNSQSEANGATCADEARNIRGVPRHICWGTAKMGEIGW